MKIEELIWEKKNILDGLSNRRLAKKYSNGLKYEFSNVYMGGLPGVLSEENIKKLEGCFVTLVESEIVKLEARMGEVNSLVKRAEGALSE